MRDILIVIGKLTGGGAEKVLVDLIKNINHEKYNITVKSIYEGEIYEEEIKSLCRYSPIIKKRNNKRLDFFVEKLVALCIKFFPKFMYKIFVKEKYDLEIAFLEGISTRFIAGSNNEESKKYAWVHIDLEKYDWIKNMYISDQQRKAEYQIFDKIICVSEDTKKAFIKRIFESENIIVQYNPIDRKQILKKAEEYYSEKVNDSFKIIAAGRLIDQKGFDRLLHVHKKLLMKGFKHELIILGNGKDEAKMKDFILKNNLTDSIKLLGFKKNPYKYIKRADLFVCSSRAEGFSLVIAESLVLGIPIVSTDCAGPRELLNNGEFGVLTTNDEEGLYEGIKLMLEDKLKYNFYKQKALERSRIFNINKIIIEIENLFDKAFQ